MLSALGFRTAVYLTVMYVIVCGFGVCGEGVVVNVCVSSSLIVCSVIAGNMPVVIQGKVYFC